LVVGNIPAVSGHVPGFILVRVELSNVRHWPIADMALALHMSAFGSKADVAFSRASPNPFYPFGGRRLLLLLSFAFYFEQTADFRNYSINLIKPVAALFQHRRKFDVAEGGGVSSSENHRTMIGAKPNPARC
jgi:hypothetical protein